MRSSAKACCARGAPARHDPTDRSQQAEADLIDIVAFIGSDNPAAALRLSAKLNTRAGMLAEFPKAGRADASSRSRRMFVVDSYVILYREIEDGIEVLRFLHGRRDLRRL